MRPYLSCITFTGIILCISIPNTNSFTNRWSANSPLCLWLKTIHYDTTSPDTYEDEKCKNNMLYLRERCDGASKTLAT